MITVTSFLTENYHSWAILFLETFKKQNGEDIKIVLTTLNTKRKYIRDLECRYANLDIREKEVNIEECSKRAGVSLSEFLNSKDRCFKGYGDGDLWKRMVAKVRYRNVKEVIEECYTDETEIYVNYDIDVAFVRPLDTLIEEARECVFLLGLGYNREKLHNQVKQLWGGLQTFNNKKDREQILLFMNTWIKYINAYDDKDTLPIGQHSLYSAYKELMDKIDVNPLDKHHMCGTWSMGDRLGNKTYCWSFNKKKGFLPEGIAIGPDKEGIQKAMFNYFKINKGLLK